MSEGRTGLRWVGVLVGVAMPSIVTWCYFVLLADSDSGIQQGTYSFGKVIQFGFPIVWILYVLKHRLFQSGMASVPLDSDAPTWSRKTSLVFGVAVGLAVSAAMFGIYYFCFPSEVQQTLTSHIVQRVQGFSVDSWPKFVGLGVFYALVHSLLEEYYYRWFVFGQLRHVAPLSLSMVFSGLAFMGHHVIVLAHYFGGMTLITVGLSSAIAIGGMIWAWQYEKSRSLLGRG